MIQKLLNHQQMPRPFGMKAGRLNAVTKSLMVLFAMLLFPQGTWAQTITNITNYNLWIGGNRVTSENLADIPGATQGKISFEPDGRTGGTLTLDNVESSKQIFCKMDYLIIKLKGDNTITIADSASAIKADYYYSSKLTIQKDGDAASLTISNDLTDGTRWPLIWAFQSVDYSTAGLSLISPMPVEYTQTSRNTPDGTTVSANGFVPIYDKATQELEINSLGFSTITVYPLWLAGTQVTEANQYDISPASPGISFKPANGSNAGELLFDLNGDTMTGNIISNLDNLDIAFTNDNNILPSYDSPLVRSMNNNAVLKFTDKTSNGSGGSLNMEIDHQYHPNSPLIEGFKSIEFGDGVYQITSVPTTYASTTAGLVNAKDNSVIYELHLTNTPYYPIWMVNPTTQSYSQAYYDQISSATGLNGQPFAATVDNTGVAAITKYTLTLKDQDLNGNHIVSNLNNLTIELGGTNTMTADSDTDPIIESLNNNATLSFSTIKSAGSASLEMSNSTQSTNSIISGFSNISLPSDLSWRSADISYQEKKLLNGGDLAHSAILETIVGGQTGGQTIEYELWISGTRVTSANAGNVFNTINNDNGEPTVKYEVNKQKLTLNGASNISVNGSEPGIKSGLPDLTIYIESSTSFQVLGNPTAAAIEGEDNTQNITFDFNTSATTPIGLHLGGIDIIKNVNKVSYNNGLKLWNRHNVNLNALASIMPSPWQGSGESGDPYQITTASDLSTLADYVNQGYIITQHFGLFPANSPDGLDCSSLNSFPSIGMRVGNYELYSFDGTFDGKDKKITKLTSPYGLFTHVGSTGKVMNLTLDNCKVSGETDGSLIAPAVSAGGIVAELRGGTIQHCNVTGGTVSGGSNAVVCFVGGIVGDMSGTVEDCVVNNVTITEPNASRTSRQGVGGIAGYVNGSVSGCQVMGTTTISNMTSVANDLYTGAIIGEKSSGTLSNNTYEGSVQVTTQTAGANAVTKSGNTQRGTGTVDGKGNYDIFDNGNGVAGVVLTGLKKINVTSSSKGDITFESGYYRIADDKSYAEVLPYNVSNQKTKMKAQSKAGYDTPDLFVKKSSNSDWVDNLTTTTDEVSYYQERTFDMPNEDVNASATFPINFSNTNRTFSISEPTGGTKVYDGSDISISKIKTKLDNTELELSSTDFTITSYKNTSTNVTTTTAPQNAGSYEATIVPVNGSDNKGTRDIPFTITQASTAISASDVTLPYNGNQQAYSGVQAGYQGTVTITYYTSDTDRIGNSNGTTDAPTDAGQYFVQVTQSDPNYSSSPADALFTISRIDIPSVDIEIQDWVYGNYDATKHGPSLTKGSNPENGGVTFKYKIQGAGDGTYDTTLPTDAGKYTVQATIAQTTNYNAATVTKDFTISRADIASVGVTITGWTYGQYDATVNSPKLTAGSNPGGADANDIVYEYKKQSDPSYTGTVPTDAGEYTVRATVPQTKNYNAASGTANFTINAANINTVGVTITGWTYGQYDATVNSPQLSAGSNPGNATVTFEYKKKSDPATSYNRTVPTDAGEYTVRASIPAKGNYNAATGTKDFTISRADIASVGVTITGWTYGNYDATVNSPNLSAGSNPGGAVANTIVYEYKKQSDPVTAYNTTVPTDAGDYMVRVSVPQTKNYNANTGTANFTISRVDIASVGVTITGWTYGNYDATANSPKLSAGSNPGGAVANTIVYEYKKQSDPVTAYNTTVPTDAGDYTVRASVPQTTNYNANTGTANFTISRADIASVGVTITGWTYGNYDATANSPKLSAGSNPGNATVTFEYKKQSDPATAYSGTLPTDAGDYTVRATVPQTTNYNANTGTADFTISPATITDVTVDKTQFIYFPNDPKTVNVTEVKAGNLILGKNDYDVYDNVKTAVGNYTLSVKGKGNYTGTLTVDWRISERVVNIDFQGRTYRTFYNASETFLIPNDVKAYIVTGVSGNTATVKEVSYIPAGTPVLLESAPGAQTTVNANEVFTGNRLKYATGPNFNAQPYYYVLYSNEFVKATGDLTGKVYLDATGLPANARTLTISHDGDATAIDALFTEEGDGEQWFDMQGRRINKPTKAGLYIRNGKKVVIKK